eukprot:6882241-Prymnesium_polylepis.1
MGALCGGAGRCWPLGWLDALRRQHRLATHPHAGRGATHAPRARHAAALALAYCAHTRSVRFCAWIVGGGVYTGPCHVVPPTAV